jgi:hypothetical protein
MREYDRIRNEEDLASPVVVAMLVIVCAVLLAAVIAHAREHAM